MRITSLTDITDEMAAAGPKVARLGVKVFFFSLLFSASTLRVLTKLTILRRIFMTTTFQNDLSLLTSVFDLWKTSTSKIARVAGLSYALSIQALPPSVTSKSGPLGGNSLGLHPSADGPLIICLLTISWNSAADDATVAQVGRGLINQIDQASRSRGLFHRFKYLNYADADQDPIAGYGPEVRARLRTVSGKYDPLGFFQRAMPGGFKL